ncbi:hypothetical protein [Arthrobacter sp. S39]|uniref:hypothetical protein n=1 Tax=Arthrobacter sp. S39 TaxID=2509720 RepID=UPI0010377AF2|nr:hypothetical protein [Arthrobacter sp. S39]TAP39607.1 hypothetical protein EYS21_21820 [Arthrobacter sp. S39]
MSMSKDLAETLTALATLVTLPELTTSQLGWLVVLFVLFDRRDRRNGMDERSQFEALRPQPGGPHWKWA